jgi:hypothetical protein
MPEADDVVMNAALYRAPAQGGAATATLDGVKRALLFPGPAIRQRVGLHRLQFPRTHKQLLQLAFN